MRKKGYRKVCRLCSRSIASNGNSDETISYMYYIRICPVLLTQRAGSSRNISSIGLFKPEYELLQCYPRSFSATKRKTLSRAFPLPRAPSFEYVLWFVSFFCRQTPEHRPRAPTNGIANRFSFSQQVFSCPLLILRNFSNTQGMSNWRLTMYTFVFVAHKNLYVYR